MSDPRRDEMTFRIPEVRVLPPARPAFSIVIPAEDGTELVRMTEENGVLVVTGIPDRWDEGAKRFLFGMMQWSGQVGIAWKDEVKKAAREGGW